MTTPHLDGVPKIHLVSDRQHYSGHPGETTGSAARWLPGQIFSDAEHGIALSVDRATATGFVVTIHTGSSAAAVPGPTNAAIPMTALAGARPSGPWDDEGARPTILADQRGVYAIWSTFQGEDGDGIMAPGTKRADIYFSHQPVGGEWAPAVRVNDECQDVRSAPALAVDRAGNAVAAWLDDRAGVAAVYAARRPAGGVWGKNVKLSSGATDGYSGLAIIVDWEDTVHVTWDGVDRCGGDEAVWGEGE